MRRRLVSVLIAAGVCASALGAAQSPQEPTFRVATHAVSVYATVIDSAHHLVPNLTRGDFSVLDNGRPQTVTVFRNDVQPISIVVMLDRSGSMAEYFDLVRDAAATFVNNLLPDDRARIGSFSDRVQIDPPDFTSDREELLRILRENLQDAGPTPLWNATYAAMNALSHQEGRRVVLVFTDGRDSPENRDVTTSLKDVVRRSQTDDVMVYAIGLAGECSAPDPVAANVPAGSSGNGARLQRKGGGQGPRGPGGGQGPRGPGGGGPGRIGGRIPGRGGPAPRGGPLGGGPPVDVVGGGDRRGPEGAGGDVSHGGFFRSCSGPDSGLKVLAEEGGGGYFELRSTANLNEVFARVAEELHHQYTLGFTPAVLDGATHTLDVRVSASNMTVRARRSYVAR